MSTKRWPEDRQYREPFERDCHCEIHSKASDICGVCEDWHSWSSTDLPDVICSECGDSYHLRCLPMAAREPGSWNVCSEIDNDGNYYCGYDIRRFELLQKQQYQNLQDKIREEDKKAPGRVYWKAALTFYDSFRWNAIEYQIGEFIEVELPKESIGIGRIHSTFMSKTNKFKVVVEWYWSTHDEKAKNVILKRYPDDGDYRLFEEDESFYIDEISVDSVIGKVHVDFESEDFEMDEIISKRHRLESAQRSIKKIISNGECWKESKFKNIEHRSAYVVMTSRAFNSLKGKILKRRKYDGELETSNDDDDEYGAHTSNVVKLKEET